MDIIITTIVGACAIWGLIFGIDAYIRLNKVEKELNEYKKHSL